MKERYRREIEDILSNIEIEKDDSSKQDTENFEVESDSEPRSLIRYITHVRPFKVILSSIILLAVALLIGPIFPSFLGSFIAWAAVVIFIVGYSLVFISPSQKYEKRWRGQPIDEPELGFFDKVRRKLSGM